MDIFETGVSISLEDGKEFEDLCINFCHVIYQLQRMRDEKLRKMHTDLAEMVMETLENQFSEKAQNQYFLRKAARKDVTAR